MFTGLIEEVGTVLKVIGGSSYKKIKIAASIITSDMKNGDSIAIDGACQTVVGYDDKSFTIETLEASLIKTSLGKLQTNSKVNLERALALNSRLGGHFVMGHVNGTATIMGVSKKDNNIFIEIHLPVDLLQGCIQEGSITVDGISLTISTLSESSITVNLIPHTYENTGLKYKKNGDIVNIEVDMIGKYVERFMSLKKGNGLTQEKLKQYGF